MENVITLGKLIGLLLFCPSPFSILFLKTPNELTRPVMETIFLVNCGLLNPQSLKAVNKYMNYLRIKGYGPDPHNIISTGLLATKQPHSYTKDSLPIFHNLSYTYYWTALVKSNPNGINNSFLF